MGLSLVSQSIAIHSSRLLTRISLLTNSDNLTRLESDNNHIISANNFSTSSSIPTRSIYFGANVPLMTLNEANHPTANNVPIKVT